MGLFSKKDKSPKGSDVEAEGESPPPYSESPDKMHPIYSDGKYNVSTDSLDKIDSTITDQFNVNAYVTYLVNRVSKSVHYNKLLLDEHNNPVFFVEHHDFHKPHIQLRRGATKEAPSVAQASSNMWMTKLDLEVFNGSGTTDALMKNRSKWKHDFAWAPPNAPDTTFVWKSTGKDEIDGKSKKWRSNFKMIHEETGEVVAIVVWGKGMHWYKLGSFTISQPAIDKYGQEWEYMTLMGGIALLDLQLKVYNNAIIAGNSASSAAVLTAIT